MHITLSFEPLHLIRKKYIKKGKNSLPVYKTQAKKKNKVFVAKSSHSFKFTTSPDVDFHSLAQTSPSAILIYNDKKNIYVNEAAERITGYSNREMLKMKFWEVVHPEERKMLKKRELDRLEGKKVPTTYELRIITKDGSIRFIEYTANKIEYKGQVAAIGVAIDITEKKLAQKKSDFKTLQRIRFQASLLELLKNEESDIDKVYKLILKSVARELCVERVSIWFFSNDRKHLDCKLLYIKSRRSFSREECIKASEYPRYFKALNENLNITADNVYENRHTNEFTENYLRPLNISSMIDIPIRSKGKVIGVICCEHTGKHRHWTEEEQDYVVAISEITSSNIELFERLKIEKSLQNAHQDLKSTFQLLKAREEIIQSEKEKLEVTLRSIGEAVITTDAKGKIILLNKTAELLTGWTQSEAKGLPLNKVFSIRNELTHKRRSSPVSKVLSTGKAVKLENHTQIISKDGTVKTISDLASPVYDVDGKLLGVVLVFRDTTEHETAEKKIRENEERYRTLFESANDAILILHNNVFVGCNHKAEEMFQCSRNQIIGKPPYEFSPVKQPDGVRSKKVAVEKIKKALEGFPQNFEWIHLRADGSPFFAEISLNKIILQEGKYLQAIVRDVTERKKAVDDLRQSESLLRNILEMSNISMAIVSFDGTIEYINRQAVKTFGYLNEDIPNMERWWVQAYPDETYRNFVVDQWTGLVNKAIREGCDIERHEYLTTCKDGSVKSMLIFGIIVANKVFVMFEDITERKKHEEALRNSEERYRSLVELSPDPIIVHTDGIIEYANPACIRTLKIQNTNDVIGKPAIDYVHPDYRDMVLERIKKSLRFNNDAPLIEEKFIRNDGVIIDVEVTAIPFVNRGKKSMLTVFRDITEYNKSQNKLQESEERFRLISSVSSDYMFSTLVKPDGKLDHNWVAGAFEKITGYSFEEYKAKGGWRATLHPDDLLLDDADLLRLKTNQTVATEIRTINKNGIIKWVKVFAHPVWDKNKNCLTGIFGGVQDIDERKRAEEALSQAYEENKLILNSAAEGILGLDLEGKHSFINNAASLMLGYKAEEIVGCQGHMLWHHTKPDGKSYPINECRILDTFKSCKVVNVSDEVFWRKDGTSFPVEYTSTPLLKQNKVAGVVVTFKDITERKKAEEALKESEEKYRTLIDSTDTGFVIIDEKGNVLDANQRYIELAGYNTLDDIKNRSVIEWTSDHYKAINSEAVRTCRQLGYIRNLEIEYAHSDGKIVPVDISATAVKTENGIVMMSLVTDISERKKSEEELQKNRLLLRSMIDALPAWISAMDKEARYIIANKYYTKTFKIPIEQITNKSAQDVFPPDKYRLHKVLFDKCIETNKTIEYEDRLEFEKGKITSIIGSYSPLINTAGEISGVTAFALDISNLKNAEESLKKFKFIVDNTAEEFYLVDPYGKIEYVNNAAARSLGYAVEELINKEICNFDRTFVTSVDYHNHFLSLKANELPAFETHHKTKDGRLLTKLVKAVYIKIGENEYVCGFANDISESKKASDLIKQSEEKFRLLFTSTIQAVTLNEIILDKDGNPCDYRILDANPAFELHTGLKCKDVIGKKVLDILPNTEPFWINEFGEVALTGKPKHIENYSAELKKYFDFTIYSPKKGQFALISTDITDRKLEEENKKLNEKRLEALVRLNNLTDKSNEKLSNFALEEAIKLSGSKIGFLAFLSDDEKIDQIYSWSDESTEIEKLKNQQYGFATKHTAILSLPIQNKKPVIVNDFDIKKINTDLYSNDHHIHISKYLCVPVFELQKLVLIVAVANKENDYSEIDITQLALLMNGMWGLMIKNKAEKALKESEERYRFLADNSNDIIVKYGTNGRISYISPVCKKLLGYDYIDIVQHSVFEFFHPDDIPTLRKYQDKLLNQMAPNLIKHRLRKKDGSFIWFESNNQIINNPDGSINEVVAVIRDITELLQAENLIKEKEAAELANKAKSEFLANMSHEIRNPLNAIIGLTNSLGSTQLNDEQSNLVEYLKISSNNLLSTLTDILDFSKIEANKVEVQKSHFNIRNLIKDIHSSYVISAEFKQLAFDFDIDDNVHADLIGDSIKLKQILINFTGNALKFTEKGSIKIRVKVVSEEDKNIVLRIEVTDTGIGIKEEDSHKLFESFSQLDSSTTKSFAGTGLGLAIVKRYAELMNGTVGFESEFGKGSTFYAVLPFQKSTKPSSEYHFKKIKMNDGIKKPIILLVEDDGINQLYLKGFLNKMGFEVDTAFNGLQALEKFNAKKFDLILMDGQMPKMDGFEATRRIREIEKQTHRHTIIIAITGYAVSGDKEKFLSAGMDDYISKPVDESRLLEVIQQYSQKTSDEANS